MLSELFLSLIDRSIRKSANDSSFRGLHVQRPTMVNDQCRVRGVVLVIHSAGRGNHDDDDGQTFPEKFVVSRKETPNRALFHIERSNCQFFARADGRQQFCQCAQKGVSGPQAFYPVTLARPKECRSSYSQYFAPSVYCNILSL